MANPIEQIKQFLTQIKEQALSSAYASDNEKKRKYMFSYQLKALFFDCFGSLEFQSQSEDIKENIINEGREFKKYCFNSRLLSPLRYLKLSLNFITLLLDTAGSYFVIRTPSLNADGNAALNVLKLLAALACRAFFAFIRGAALLAYKLIDKALDIAVALSEASFVFIQRHWKAALVILGLGLVFGAICFATGGLGLAALPLIVAVAAKIVSIAALAGIALPATTTTLVVASGAVTLGATAAALEAAGAMQKLNDKSKGVDEHGKIVHTSGILNEFWDTLKTCCGRRSEYEGGTAPSLGKLPSRGSDQTKTAVHNVVTGNPPSTSSTQARSVTNNNQAQTDDLFRQEKEYRSDLFGNTQAPANNSTSSVVGNAVTPSSQQK